VNYELERVWKEAVAAYPGIRLEYLRETTVNLSQDSRSSGRDLNPGPPEYVAGVLTALPRRSIRKYTMGNVHSTFSSTGIDFTGFELTITHKQPVT
jgi:hypothetical protein